MGCSGPVRPQPSKSPEELQGLWDKGLVQGLGTDWQVCIFSWTPITQRRRRLYKEIADRRNRKCMKKQQHLSIPGNNFSCFIYCPISFPFTTACYHAKQQAALKKTSCAQLWTSCRLSSVHHHCPLLGWRSALTPPTKSATGPHSHLSAHWGARSGPCFSTRGNYDTNEKSVNQRVTCRQEDGSDVLLQLQNSLSM